MNKSSLETFLKENEIDFYKNADLKKLVTMGTGGEAEFLIIPKAEHEFCKIILYLKSNGLKYYILGNGTNTYFCDDMYRGSVISTLRMNAVKTGAETLYAQCGALISKLSCIAYNNSLTGFEFAHGIPGSVGGAVYMNASAFGSQMSNVVHKSRAFNVSTEKIVELSNEDHLFSEKCSIFAKNGDYILLSTEFKLKYGVRDEIRHVMDEYNTRRINSQPLNKKSAGSAFKRPLGDYASKLIDKAGLKGVKIGDAQVSEKHAGFIINCGNATSNDVKCLMEFVKKRVFEQFGVMLEEEIIYVE